MYVRISWLFAEGQTLIISVTAAWDGLRRPRTTWDDMKRPMTSYVELEKFNRESNKKLETLDRRNRQHQTNNLSN